MSGASFGFPPSTGCLVRRTPVLWDPRGKRDPLQDVLNFPVWLFTISPYLNNDLSLRWERIMNHSFAFKTLIKKAQFCFHVLWWWLNYSKTAKTTSHFEVWLTSDCNVKATVAAMSMGEEREGAGREKKSRGWGLASGSTSPWTGWVTSGTALHLSGPVSSWRSAGEVCRNQFTEGS